MILTFSHILRNITSNFVLEREIMSDFIKLPLINDMRKKY